MLQETPITLTEIKRRRASKAALKAARKRMPDNPAEGLEPGFLSSVYKHRIDYMVARGKIKDHIDAEFPPWAYILVVECKDAVFVQDGCEPVPLAIGDIIEFRSHQKHRLEQRKNHYLVWLAIDSDVRLDMRKLSGMFHDLTRQ